MELLFFIYGLALFSLGILIFFTPREESQIFFARKIWLLGMYAILHACVEWLACYMYLFEDSIPYLRPLKFVLLLASYLFLFEFTRFIVRESFKEKQSKLHALYLLYAAPVIYPISLSCFLSLIIIHPSLDDAMIAVRYTYGFFGSLLLGIGLYYYSESLTKTDYTTRLKIYFKVLGIAFTIYAFLASITVAPTEYFPGTDLNAPWFLETFGLPVQFFRILCAFMIIFCSIKALQIFREETHLKLLSSLSHIKRFSSNVSHELKTPLTVMKGEMEVALQHERSILEYQHILRSSLEEIDALQSIVQNLLMLSYLEKEALKSTFQKQSLDDIALKVIDEKMVQASHKNITFQIEDLETLTVFGDEGLLKTVLSNLIDNAIKYAPTHSHIFLSLKKEGENALLYVEDEGSGIAEENLALVYDRFYRVDDSRSKHIKGFGLGLSIVKQIVHLHNGKITLANRPEKGLKASISLPLM